MDLYYRGNYFVPSSEDGSWKFFGDTAIGSCSNSRACGTVDLKTMNGVFPIAQS